MTKEHPGSVQEQQQTEQGCLKTHPKNLVAEVNVTSYQPPIPLCYKLIFNASTLLQPCQRASIQIASKVASLPIVVLMFAFTKQKNMALISPRLTYVFHFIPCPSWLQRRQLSLNLCRIAAYIFVPTIQSVQYTQLLAMNNSYVCRVWINLLSEPLSETNCLCYYPNCTI